MCITCKINRKVSMHRNKVEQGNLFDFSYTMDKVFTKPVPKSSSIHRSCARKAKPDSCSVSNISQTALPISNSKEQSENPNE